MSINVTDFGKCKLSLTSPQNNQQNGYCGRLADL